MDYLKRHWRIYRNNGRAAAAYTPKPADLQPTLLYASADKPTDNSYLRAWQDILGEALRVHQIPATHHSLLQEHLSTTLGHVNHWLNNASKGRRHGSKDQDPESSSTPVG